MKERTGSCKGCQQSSRSCVFRRQSRCLRTAVRLQSRRQESSAKSSRTHGRRRSGTRVVSEVVTCGHTMGSATSRPWGSTRMRMVQLASSRSTTAGVRFLRRTQRRVVPSELTRMCLASPRRVGWVTAGKGQRRASSGADDGVTTRTKTFVLLPFDSSLRRTQSCKEFFRIRHVRHRRVSLNVVVCSFDPTLFLVYRRPVV